MKCLFVFLIVVAVAVRIGIQAEENIPSSTVLEYFLRLDRKMISLEDNMKHLENKTENLENIKKMKGHSRKVTFQVEQVKHLRQAATGVLKFDHFQLNTGGAYNPHSGIFIASHTGTYLFWANVNSIGPANYEIILQREGQELTRGYPGHKVPGGVASITHVVKLKQGDHVWFEILDHGASKIYGDKFSSYGGTLLFIYIM